jgi:transposase
LYERRKSYDRKRDKNRVYTQEFKSKAVILAQKGEKPISQVARDLGINVGRLYQWMAASREATETGIKAFSGGGKARNE